MSGSSTTATPTSKQPIGGHDNPQAGLNTVTEVTTNEARQGKRGNRMIYVLVASILLLLIAYALIGIFSDDVLVTDLVPPTTGETTLPGPTDAQETIIRDAQ